jgi:acetyl-CoA synthetase (ADP-forming)
MVGLTRDAQFGPCVMFGLGGIFTEILEDVAFRVAPLSDYDANDIMSDIKGKKILDAFRGKPEVDRGILADILKAVGQIGLDNEHIKEIDINPLKLVDGKPVAVDALVVLE